MKNIKPSQDNLYLILGLKGLIALELGNIPEAIKYMKTHFKINPAHDNQNFLLAINSYLNNMRLAGQFVEGMSFYESLIELSPNFENNSDPLLQFNALIFYEFNKKISEATLRLNKLRELSHHSSFASRIMEEANKEHLYTLINNKDFEVARKHLNSAHFNQKQYNKLLTYLEQNQVSELRDSLDPSHSPNTNTQLIKIDDNAVDAILEAALDDNVNKFESSQVGKALSSTVTLSISEHSEVADLAPTNIIENVENNNTHEISSNEVIDFCNLDPRQIHAYFQRKKLLSSKETFNDFSQKDYHASWVTENGTVFSTKQQSVLKVEGIDHYYICVKEGVPQNQGFVAALKKGVISSAKGSIGIKFFKNHNSVEFVEIKTNSGQRAWAKTLYKNDKGEFLIVIDGYGNHVAAGKAANVGIKVISVQSALNEDSFDVQQFNLNVKYNEETHFNHPNKDYLKDDDVNLAGDV